MPQDAFTLRLIAKELNTALTGGRINRINQPDKEEVSLLIYTGKETLKLTLSANASFCGAYFTADERENPLVAPNFCMLLRKHIQGAEILSVEMPGFERILCFRLHCTSDFSDGEKCLYAEIMGKYSNLILVENGVILGALKTTSLDVNAKRIIFAGAPYLPPAAQDKTDPSSLPALKALLAGRAADAQFLFRNISGLAPSTAEDIAARFQGGDLAQFVYDYIFSDEISPCLVIQDSAVKDFTARGRTKEFPSLLEAQSKFYTRKREERTKDTLSRRVTSILNTAIKKHEKRLAITLEKQLACARFEEDRLCGELLTANLYALSRGMKSCTLVDWNDGSERKIVLDARLSPAENAQAYYRRYRKQKRTLEALAPQEQETRQELDYLYSLLAAVRSAEDLQDLHSAEEELTEAGLIAPPKQRGKQKKAEIPFRVYERGGFRILAGRNNLQNDKLLRSCSPDDLWLHARRYHSCHTVIRSAGKEVPEDVLAFAAALCARYSDGGGEKIPVDCCPLKYVKKPPKAKAGFVIYSEFKTLLGDPALVT